jgi:nicotinate-nucleotide adenylyltransferase
MEDFCLTPSSVRLLPPHNRGQRIGLLGGSFNPPHAAHRLISLIALRRLKLDAIWWLVTPGNPLKSNNDLLDMSLRMKKARLVANHPRLHITALESLLKTRYTIDTLRQLIPRCPGVHFVWLMGSDNLVQFHHWKNWHKIAKTVPIAVIDRPGTTLKALHSHAAQSFARFRLAELSAPGLANRKAPGWIFLHDRRSTLSSTRLRHKESR